jgi:hypothetical protein
MVKQLSSLIFLIYSSIGRLSQDLLMTHSANTLMPTKEVLEQLENAGKDDPQPDWEWENAHGTLCVWRWLGFERFFSDDAFPNGEVPLWRDVHTRGSQEVNVSSCLIQPR